MGGSIHWYDVVFMLMIFPLLGAAIHQRLQRKWVYLGVTELNYVDKETGKKVMSRHYVHFYGKGKHFTKRKVNWDGKDGGQEYIRQHCVFQRDIVPWLAGDCIRWGIEDPSETLRKYAVKELKYKFDVPTQKWVKLNVGELTDD